MVYFYCNLFWVFPYFLNITTEQEEIHLTYFGMTLKWRIARHLKLLYASEPNLPKCTCKAMHDLPLRSEKEQIIGFEKSLNYFPHIYNTITFMSSLK